MLYKILSYCRIKTRTYRHKKRNQRNLKKWKNRHKKLNTIIVVGDSHVNFFGGHEHISFSPIMEGLNSCRDINDKFSTLHLGPSLAYNLNKNKSSTQAKEKLKFILENKIIPTGAHVIFVLGEIDLRVHVLRQAIIQNISVHKIIQNILDVYLKELDYLRQKYKINISVYGPIASQISTRPCYGPIASQIHGFPCFGSEEERNKVTLLFNELLEHSCKDLGFTFITIAPKIINKNYLTKSEYIADGCHLSQKAYPLVQTELEKKGLFNSL